MELIHLPQLLFESESSVVESLPEIKVSLSVGVWSESAPFFEIWI